MNSFKEIHFLIELNSENYFTYFFFFEFYFKVNSEVSDLFLSKKKILFKKFIFFLNNYFFLFFFLIK
jgi:hypothetical protein